jgi:PilZ domain
MERRNAARMMVDLPTWCLLDGFRHACRAVDLSATGMLLERGRSLEGRDPLQLGAYELHLEGRRPIRVRGRTVRAEGRVVAVRFVVMHDVDRLTIAEHADRLTRTSGVLH